LATFPYTGFPDGQPYPNIPLGTTTTTVSSSAALSTALANATAGTRIVLGSGTYSGAFTLTGKVGTAGAGISIEAATQGGAIFAAGSTWVVKDCQQVTLKGLTFSFEPSSGNVVAFRGTSRNCRITRCTFGPTTISTSPGTTKATFVYGGDSVEYIRVDHNEIRNKANPGNAILFDGNFDTNQACKHIRIDHNYVHDIRPEVDNEKEPIRLGVSQMSKTFSYSVVERNRFEACIAEPEITSIKACGVRVSGNAYVNSIGGPVYRHGTNGVMSDNYVVDTGTSSGGGPAPGTQTLGVGGVATPAGAILATSDKPGTALTLTSSDNGTASNPKVFDGMGKKIGRVTFDGCQYIVVQNYYIMPSSQYGVVFDDASNVTLQNCDVSDVRRSGDGDLNAITLWGGTNVKIRYCTAVNYVSGDPGDSHTDVVQTWVSSSHPNAATNVQIIGNKFVGPANPSRDNSVASIHQCIMVESAGHGGNSGGSGTPNNWFVAENEFGDSWGQSIKLDSGNNFTFTRNRWTGSSDHVFEFDGGSGNVVYSDNSFGSGYGSIGATVTNGSGPPTPTS
jgi:pectate lyase